MTLIGHTIEFRVLAMESKLRAQKVNVLFDEFAVA
jgi:hypothetical protein